MKIWRILILLALVCFLCAPAFAKKDKGNALPPGLQKKAAKGEPLPPGWQKKLVKGEIMAIEVYHHGEIVVPIDRHGLVTLRIEGKLVRLLDATREIIEVLE